MAHIAQINGLTSELITLITSTSPENDPKRFNLFREASLRSLRQHNFARTNQFEVEDRLNGLQERLYVADGGRDALADALRDRREELLLVEDKWTPDILHFLLELSDKPVEKVKLRDLDWLLPKLEEAAQPALRWEDIAMEDGWNRDGALWRDVDHGASSDEETFVAGSDASSDSGSTSPSDDVVHTDAMTGIEVVPRSSLVLERIQVGQAWRHGPAPTDTAGRQRKIAAPELQLVREVLWMLQGLETTLFDAKCVPNLTYQLSDVSWDVYKHMITAISEYGRRILPLRRYSVLKQEAPLLQVFQDCIRQKLRLFDRRITDVQSRFVAIRDDTVVSLAAVVDELRPDITPLHGLGAIIEQLDQERCAHSFRYLELLYDATCVAQLAGNNVVYSFLGEIFLDCFQVYLRPIRLWMEEGELVPGDKSVFVASADVKVPLSRMWQDQYHLCKTEKGVLHAPRFLETTVSKIFTTGKSVVMLKHLGQYENARRRWKSDEPGFGTVLSSMAKEPAAPFSELFGEACDAWIRSKHHAASADLQKLLFESCGLWSSLDALHAVFLMSQGSLIDTFASRVFENIDADNTTWRDRFALTEMLQEAFSTQTYGTRLSASITPTPNNHSAIDTLRTTVPSILPALSLPWPVQLIITPGSIAHYHSIFTLLLLLKRAMYTLTRHHLRADIYARPNAENEAYYALRSRLVWFVSTIQVYLATQVLAPLSAAVRADLRAAEDVDAMIAAHRASVEAMVAGACLGGKVAPIRDCMLDVLVLCGRLEGAKEMEALREAGSVDAVDGDAKGRRGVYVNPVEEEEDEANMIVDSDNDGGRLGELRARHDGETYGDVLRSIRADFDRHLRFVAGGLRGVARASSELAAGKWDVLAEALETGIREQR